MFFAFGSATAELGLRELDRAVLLAISSGASVGAKRAYELHRGYFEQFGNLTFDKARAFSGIFAMAMVSRWVRHLCVQDARLDRREMWGRLTRDVLTSFEGFTDERYEESWWVDVQFNHGEDIRAAPDSQRALQHTNEHLLLLSLAARALGFALDWTPKSPPIPASSAYELWKGGIEAPPGLNWTDLDSIGEFDVALAAAEASMYGAFDALRQDAVTS